MPSIDSMPRERGTSPPSNERLAPPGSEAERSPGARRASGLALTSLATIVVGFFLPTLRACGQMERPLHYLPAHPAAAGWIVPPYAASLILLIVAAVLFVRGRSPERAAFVASWVACGLSFLGTTATLIGWLSETRPSYRLITWSTAMICVALVVVQRAARTEDWARWIRLLGAHAVLTAGNAIWILIVTAMSDGAWDAIGIGGHLFFWGSTIAGALAVYGARGSPPRLDAQP